ncbi:MAG: WecB/TagA/CpsF family glycosyltransferase [Alphaproteobacteria bacterium]|nr:WecB/TagA/CpsF family glycosyltransferase [Alphaproteobacteria bacterium]
MKFQIGPQHISITVPDRASLLEIVESRLEEGMGFALATLNVDHLEKLRSDETFRAAYAAHDLIVADGNPVVWLARLGGQSLSLVPGSELVVPLCQTAARLDKPIAIIAGTRASGQMAAERLAGQIPGLDIAMIDAPGFPFDPSGAEADILLDRLDASKACLCLLAVGAPRQEILAARGRVRCPRVGFASVGAGIDFIAGRQKRAPKFVRSMRMEWLWRATLSPLRLGPRYLRGAMILPGHAIRARVQRRERTGG